jgi:diacylglycerol kinase (ATP)
VPDRVTIIANPISGQGRAGRRVQGLRRRLTEDGCDVTFRQTEAPGHAIELAMQVPDGDLAVLVAGGDGTVRETAAGLLDRDIPLYHVPMGNENLFCREFGGSVGARKVLSALRSGRRRKVDVLRFADGTIAVACLGVGFDARVVELVDKNRTGPAGDLDYMLPIWRTLTGYPFPPMRVVADGQILLDGPGTLLVGNLSHYAASIPAFSKARPDDGFMDVLAIPCTNRWEFLGAAGLVIGRLERLGDLRRVRARHLTVYSDEPLPVQIDGDVGPPTPLEVTLEPGCLTVLEGVKKRRR